MPTKGKTYKRIGAVQKACDILDYLGSMKEPVTGEEISHAVGLPPGTVMSHLATLQDAQFVEESYGAYEIGMKFGTIWQKLMGKKLAQRKQIDDDIARLSGGNENG